MFAAASGARLAHRHNQAIKKQLGTSNTDGLQVNCKAFEKNQHAKYSDTPGIHGQRKPQRCYHNYTSNLYSSDSESVSKLSSSYVDLHGKIPKFGHVDFEGKAAWQDREHGPRPDRRQSAGVSTEAAAQRFKQKEAHKRWVKRNRIQDSTYSDCSSDDEDGYGGYGAQNTAANALLYVGLGTMCIGMIIAFVGTGDKGFKTIELRLIGPSLIGAGVLITILRVLLCVCPSKCLRFNRNKLKNSSNKLNSEDECEETQWKDGIECVREGNPLPEPQTGETLPLTERTTSVKKPDTKKRVQIAELPTTSTAFERGEGIAMASSHLTPVEEMIFTRGKKHPITEKEVVATEIPFDLSSIGSDVSIPSHITRIEGEIKDSSIGSDISIPSHITRTEGEIKDSSIHSDISLSSQLNAFLDSDSLDSEMSSKTVKNASKFESQRSPKNAKSEILLNPSNLDE